MINEKYQSSLHDELKIFQEIIQHTVIGWCKQMGVHFLSHIYFTLICEWWVSGRDVNSSTSGMEYRKTSNISRTLVGNKIVDNSDVVGASPVGAAPTTSSFST